MGTGFRPRAEHPVQKIIRAYPPGLYSVLEQPWKTCYCIIFLKLIMQLFGFIVVFDTGHAFAEF